MTEQENPYESRKLLDEYLLFHYGTEGELLPYADGPVNALNFAARTVRENLPGDVPRGRALDVGCAVGRSSFELSRICEAVIGIDFSSTFIEAAESLRLQGEFPYFRLEEGMLRTPLVARPPEGSRPNRITFETGDAMRLRGDLGAFEIVHAANLICRLPEPGRFLSRLPELVLQGGTLVLTTPCTWLAEFTPPRNWPSGATLDWLRAELETAFDLKATRDMPFLIRETARKYQWTVAQASVWTRR